MKRIISKGKTTDEATRNGLKMLGIEESGAVIKILKEGKAGMLGMFGGEEAEVEVARKVSIGEDAKEVLQEIINGMNLLAAAELISEENGDVLLDVKGEDLGKIIGKDGIMLKSLQLLVSTIASRNFSQRVRVNIDAGGYKSKQEQALARIAADAANDVIESGEEKALPPMNAADRRIIHLALSTNDKVTTYSTGEGADRRLVIAPKKDAAA